MASLDVGTEAVVKQDIVDRYADWVSNYANANLSWGTNVYPFGEWTYGSLFGGPTTGKAISINGTSLSNGSTGDLINEERILQQCTTDANRYNMFRRLRATLTVGGSGGNTGTRPVAGVVYDQTAWAYLTAGYANAFAQPTAPTEMVTNGLVQAADLEAFFSSLRNAWYNATVTSIGTYNVNVCHASCHTSCHSSRGRR